MWKSACALMLVSMATVAPAHAQERPLCFDPGTSRLSPDGYASARAVAVDMAAHERFRAHVILRAPGVDPRAPLMAERVAEAQLELMKTGVGIQSVEIREATVADPDCLSLEVVAGNRPLSLWHFYGPYFDFGSAEVSPLWRRSLRFLVATYVPGQLRYCIEAHSDTAGSAEKNLDLSRRRAENVALELVRQGVRWEDTETRWFGETLLARSTADGVAEPLNRRAFVDRRTRCAPTSR